MEAEEIKMFAKIERDMDSGKTKYVVYDGQRNAFPNDIFETLGLESGQTVTYPLLLEIMKFNLSNLKAKIAVEKAVKVEVEGR